MHGKFNVHKTYLSLWPFKNETETLIFVSRKRIWVQEMDTVLKEAANFRKAMRRKLFDVCVVTELRIISTYSNDFVILFTLQKKFYFINKGSDYCPDINRKWSKWDLLEKTIGKTTRREGVGTFSYQYFLFPQSKASIHD